uniref:Uncharacterized protein n=1 Tax=Arundo donax TaxID=35708 RepID=A0A0A9HQD2_ARUDO
MDKRLDQLRSKVTIGRDRFR